MRKFLLFIALLSCAAKAQNLNEFKYAIVPEKFSFLKESNQYNLSLKSKLFMQKYGFETYFNNEVEVPTDFLQNNCNKVYFDLIEVSNMFSTKIKVVLKDCKGTVLVTSDEGMSRDKEYKVAYNEALSNALNNFSQVKNHIYQPTKSNFEKNSIIENKTEIISFSEPLLAKPLGENGFELFTSNVNLPRLVMTIYKTSSPDCFLASMGNKNAVLLKKMNNWYFEYYLNEKLISEKITLTF